jgi:hypothetical protein
VYKLSKKTEKEMTTVTPWTFDKKIIFREGEYAPEDQALLLRIITKLYYESETARNMLLFHFNKKSEEGVSTISLKRDFGKILVFYPTGELYLTPSTIDKALYITPNGRSVKETLVGTLAHELVHVVRNLDDPTNLEGLKPFIDYTGPTVELANQIWGEVKPPIPQQLSYYGYDRKGEFLRENYQYTGGAAIDTAFVVGEILKTQNDWTTKIREDNTSGGKKDLLIGDFDANKLETLADNDFLWGMGGNDTLDGGDGIDTAGYYAAYANNFKIRQQGNDQVLTQIAGPDRAGEDTLRNIERVRCGNKVYEIKKAKDIVILVELSAIGDDLTRLSSMILNAVSDSGKIISDTRVKIAAYGQNGLVQSEFFRDLNLSTSKKALQRFVNGLSSSSQPDTTIRYDNQQILNVLSSNSSLWRSDVDKKIIAISTHYDHDDYYGYDYYYEEPALLNANLSNQVQLAAASSGVGIDRLVYDSNFLDPFTGFDYNNSAGAVMLYDPYSSPEDPGNLDLLINASFNRPEIRADISLTNASINYSSLSGGAVVSDFLLTSGAIPGNLELTYEISGEDYNGYIYDGNISIRDNKLVVDEGFTTHVGSAPDYYDYSSIIRYYSDKLDFIVTASISGLPVAIYDKVSLEITNIPEYEYIGPL